MNNRYLVNQSHQLHNRTRQQFYSVLAASPEDAITRVSAMADHRPGSTLVVEHRLAKGAERGGILPWPTDDASEPVLVATLELRTR
ncbi:MAG: hypothetical protein AB7J35_21270 [Dehalococcoidia bacterium]